MPTTLDEPIRFTRAPGVWLVFVQRHRGFENWLHYVPRGPDTPKTTIASGFAVAMITFSSVRFPSPCHSEPCAMIRSVHHTVNESLFASRHSDLRLDRIEG